MITSRSIAPVLPNIRWLLLTLAAWQVLALLRRSQDMVLGSWPIGLFELLLLTAVPAVAAFAFVRLFTAIVQAGYGSLNAYTLTSSPWAWVFWLAFGAALVGHGIYLTTDVLLEVMPEAIRRGAFADDIRLLHDSLGLWVLGLGFVFMTVAIMVIGLGTVEQVIGPERFLLALGSCVTYGLTTVVFAVDGGHFVAAILGSGLITGVALWIVPPAGLARDPVGLMFVPGSAAAGLLILGWSMLVGGQPTWPF